MQVGYPRKPWRRALTMGVAVLALLAAGCGFTQAGSSGGPFAGAGEEGEAPFGEYLAARFAGTIGDTAAAADYYEAALDLDPGNPILVQRTFYLSVAEGRMERALTLAERRVAEEPEAQLAQLLLAIGDIKDGDYDAAETRLNEAGRTGFAVLLRPLTLAWLEAGRGDANAAMTALEELAERNAFDTFRWFHGALINDYLDRPAAAEAAYEKTRGSAAGNVTAVVLAYASFLDRHGRGDDARRLLADHSEQFPDNAVVSAALQDLKAGRQLGPLVDSIADGIAEALHGAAGALARDQAIDAAKVYTRLALYMRPGYDSAQMLLGEILDSDGRLEEAIAAYRRIDEESPYHWEARVRISAVLNRLDRTAEALDLLRDMAAQRRQDVTALIERADILRGHERYEEAAAGYGQAIRRLDSLEPRHWALLYARGVAFERSKDWPRAEADFLRALELMPEQPLVLNYLGYSWVERGEHLSRARKMIERAVEQRPNDGYIVDSLGWVLYRLGDYEGAVKHLERAVELRPEDPIINEHLGDALWQVGRRLEARFQWRHALALGAEQQNVASLEEKLESGLPLAKNDRGG